MTNPGEELMRVHERLLGRGLTLSDGIQSVEVMTAIADRLDAIEQRLTALEAKADG